MTPYPSDWLKQNKTERNRTMSTPTPLFRVIARRVKAVEQCKKDENQYWKVVHEKEIVRLVKEHMPSGGGFDCGTDFAFEASNPNRLVFVTSFHHMNEVGMYDGWTEHTVVIKPDLANGYFFARVTGRNKNQIKDYIAECFDSALMQLV